MTLCIQVIIPFNNPPNPRPAEAGRDGPARCHAGKNNGFRLYCHVAVKFALDARKFSFKGGNCGHGQGEWGFSAGPGAVTVPSKGWTLSVHFGFLDAWVSGDGFAGRRPLPADGDFIGDLLQ